VYVIPLCAERASAVVKPVGAIGRISGVTMLIDRNLLEDSSRI
jgi:hypothetical protein